MTTLLNIDEWETKEQNEWFHHKDKQDKKKKRNRRASYVSFFIPSIYNPDVTK